MCRFCQYAVTLSAVCLAALLALAVVGCAPETAPCCQPVSAQQETPAAEPEPAEQIAQKICPVMGGKIDPKVFVEHKGRKVYFCCPGCIGKFKADPDKYLAKLDAGQSAETESGGRTSVELCTKCGLIKGSKECCKTEGQELCAGCGLIKGSPGCCKITKGSKQKVELCLKCGFLKGSAECCKTEGKPKCSKCGLIKGSPGCCKIK